MPPSPPPTRRRKAVKTYGKPSRSKLASFKVFQDVIGEEGTEKRSWKDYNRLSHTTTLDFLPTIRQQAPNSRHSIDLINDIENPFIDPVASIESPQGYRAKAATSTAPPPSSPRLPQGNLRTSALSGKSINLPVLIESAASVRVAHANTTTIILPHSSPKNHPTKKLRLDYTPRATLGAKQPPRPRKYRHTGPMLEDQDFFTILSPSKACNPDSKSYFLKRSSVLEDVFDRPYNEPPVFLGVMSADINDSASTGSRTWAHERAKGIFNETRKAAEKVLRVTPSSTRYKSQQKVERLKLKDIVKAGTNGNSDMVGTNWESQKMQKNNIGYQAVCNNVVTETNEDIVSLQDFLQDPFSHPEDYGNYHNMVIGEEGDDPFGSHKTPEPSLQKRLWRSESTQDLLIMGSVKIETPRKERLYDSKYHTEDEDLSLFLATTNLSPGSIYDFLRPQSDNEMPSSSPVFKSTPKKEWNHSKINNNLFSSDIDSLKDMATGGPIDKNLYNETNGEQHGDELPTGGIAPGTYDYKENSKANIRSSKNNYLILRAAASEDELYYAQYDTDKEKEEKPLSTMIATKENNRNLKSEAIQSSKDLIHVGGTRTSRHAPGGRGPTRTMDGTESGVTTRITLKKRSSGGDGRSVVKSGIRRRKSSRSYEKLEVDEVDELQMDLPAMMI